MKNKNQLIKKRVLHCDGRTMMLAKGRIINGEFVGEYRFEGMTYGVRIMVDVKEVNGGARTWL